MTGINVISTDEVKQMIDEMPLKKGEYWHCNECGKILFQSESKSLKDSYYEHLESNHCIFGPHLRN